MPAVLSADVTKGQLTGSGTQDMIATAAGGSAQETWALMFRNKSGSARTISFYLNGTTADEIFATASLDASGGFCSLTLTVGPGDVLYAEASAASAINWFCTKGILT